MMELHSQPDEITAYVMGSLVGLEAESLELHAAKCAECAGRLANEAMIEERMHAIAVATAPLLPKETPTQWRPNAAAALSLLAAAAVEEPKAAPPPAQATDDLPALPQPQIQETVWRFERPAPKKKAWPLIAASFVGVALLGGIGVLGYAVIKPQIVYVQAPPVAQNTPPATVAPPTTLPAAPPAGVAAPPASPPPAAPPMVVAKLTKSAGMKGKHKGEKEDNVDPPPAAAKERSDAGGGFDDLLGGKKGNESVKTTLSRDDVLGTVKTNASSITKCADAYAKGGGKLPAKIIVKWVIKPSGFIDAPEMASPELKGTPVEACVLAAMKKWKFPEFQSGTIPVTFPFAVAQ